MSSRKNYKFINYVLLALAICFFIFFSMERNIEVTEVEEVLNIEDFLVK